MIITSILFKEKVALIRISIEKAINTKDWKKTYKRIEGVIAQYSKYTFYYSFHLKAVIYPYQQAYFAHLIGKGVLVIEKLTKKSQKYHLDLTEKLHPDATVLLQPEALNFFYSADIDIYTPKIKLAQYTNLQLANVILGKPLNKDSRLRTIRELLSYIPYTAYLKISSDCSEIMFEAQLSTLDPRKRVLLPSKLTSEQCEWLGKYARQGTGIHFPSDIETETGVNVLKALKNDQCVVLHRNTPGPLIYKLLSALPPNERHCCLQFDFPLKGIYPSRVDDSSSSSSSSTSVSSTSSSMNRLLKPYDAICIPKDFNPDLLVPLVKDETSSINIFFYNNTDPQSAVQIVAKMQYNPFVLTLFLEPYLPHAWIPEFTEAILVRKLRCKISIKTSATDDWTRETVSRIPAGCQFLLPSHISEQHATTVFEYLAKGVELLIPNDISETMQAALQSHIRFHNYIPAHDCINPNYINPKLLIPGHKETQAALQSYIRFNNDIPAPDNINPVEQNKVSNTPTPPSTKHEESPDVELFGAEDISLDVDSFFDKLPLPLSDPTPLLPSTAPQALVPQTQGPSLLSDYALTLSDSSGLCLTEIPPVTEAPPQSPPSVIVRSPSHMFSRAPKVSQEETEANERFKTLIESQRKKPIIHLPETFPFPSPRFIEKTLKRSKGIIKLHPKTDVALAIWIASALPPHIALMLPPELIAVPEIAKAIVGVLKPECTLYVDAFSPKLPEAIQILPPKVTLLLNMNKLGLPEATTLVSALPSACDLALVISPNHFIRLKDSLPDLINSLTTGCTLKVDMTWEVEYVRWLASRLKPGIGLFVPPSMRSTEDPSWLSRIAHCLYDSSLEDSAGLENTSPAIPSVSPPMLVLAPKISQAALDKLISDLPESLTLSLPKSGIHLTSAQWRALLTKPGIHIAGAVCIPGDLSPAEVEAITLKLISGTTVATQAKPDATVHGNTSSHCTFFSSRPTSKRSKRGPITVSAISGTDSLPPISSSSSNSSKHSDDNSKDDISLREAKKLSLATYPHTSDLWQQIGPRELPTMGTLVDVPDDGDCFFHAILHQSKRPDIAAILGGSELTVSKLRQQTPGISTQSRTWADHDDIHRFVACYSACILAVIDTRTPERGFISYYQSVDKEVITHSGDLEPLPDRPIIYIAHNGNHFLSVTHFNAIGHGSIQNGFDYRACFLSDDEEDCLSDESSGHYNMKRQRT